MTLIPIHQILSRKETKYFIICTVAGGVVQFFCRRYIKNHPEFFEEPEIKIEIRDPSGKTERITNELTDEIAEELAKEPILRRIMKQLRGGQIQEKVLRILLRLLFKQLINFGSERGVEIGLYIGTGIIVSAIPTKHLVKIVEDALPQNLLNTCSVFI